MVKNLPAKQEMPVQSLGQEDSLEEETAIRSRISAWRILCTDKPGGLLYGVTKESETIESLSMHAHRHSQRCRVRS